MEVELQLARKVAELPPLESATEWQVEQTRRRVIKSQLDPLEAVKGLTAEAERLELPGEELSCRFRLQLAAFGRGGCWLACSFAVGGLDNQIIFVFVIEDILVRQVLDYSLPKISIEVGQVIGSAGTAANQLSKTIWNCGVM